jgi:glycosyltransferase involved in cell wall biosynthesis
MGSLNRHSKISVCMATYNGSKFIQRQLKTILEQLDPTDEIIISDDSSTDSTLEIVRALNDPRIRLFINEGRRGPIGNFENALLKATGDLIFLSDQDDIWYPNKTEVALEALQTHDLVTSDCNIIDDDDRIIQESYYKLIDARPGFIYNLYRNSYLGCCMAFNRSVLEKCVPFPKHTPMHDIWIGAVAECFFKPIMIKDRLMGYRRHGGNFSTATSKSKFSFSQKITFRINLVMSILSRSFR